MCSGGKKREVKAKGGVVVVGRSRVGMVPPSIVMKRW